MGVASFLSHGHPHTITRPLETNATRQVSWWPVLHHPQLLFAMLVSYRRSRTECGGVELTGTLETDRRALVCPPVDDDHIPYGQ